MRVETPNDERALAAALAEGGPVEIVGGGARLGMLGAVAAERRVSVAGLRGVVLHEPETLTLAARAGTPLAEIEDLLARRGQRFAFEPPDHRKLMGSAGAPTLGGMVAGNWSGPARVSRGACRDALIGVRFVDGSGRILANGGRVMKNVTGYDLVKLLCGSWGTLGVLTELSFKLAPAPQEVATLALTGLEDAQALAALAEALATPFEPSGAGHLPAGRDGKPLTLLRLEGMEGFARRRAEKLAQALSAYGAAEILGPEPALWRDLRDVEGFAGRDGTVWRLSLKASEAAGAVASLRAAIPALEARYDWGGALVWLLAPTRDDGARIRETAARLGGHATLIRADAALRAALPPLQPLTAVHARLTQGLKDCFDPRGVLNPGRLGG